jgi:hypothetical protein
MSSRNDRLEHTIPAIGTVHVAGTQSAAFQITELVEYEQRVIAGTGIVAVPDAHLLAVSRYQSKVSRIYFRADGRRPPARYRVETEHQAAIEIEPENVRFRFTRRVSHDCPRSDDIRH